MMQLYISVEGQTEELFVNEHLQPYLSPYEIYITPILISTKRGRDGLKFKGGLSRRNYRTFRSDLEQLINSSNHGLVTTLIDYYALPSNFPKYDERVTMNSQLEKVEFLENALLEELGSPDNFIPYIQLHEFEAMLFSDKNGFISNIARAQTRTALCSIIDQYPNPEDINEGAHTAPSKRIIEHYSEYNKVIDGNLILGDIGVDIVKGKCPHFSSWLDKIIAYSIR